MSGGDGDGANGLATVKASGGITLVQSPEDAAVPDMVIHALQRGVVDYTLPLNDIGSELLTLLTPEALAPHRLKGSSAP